MKQEKMAAQLEFMARVNAAIAMIAFRGNGLIESYSVAKGNIQICFHGQGNSYSHELTFYTLESLEEFAK